MLVREGSRDKLETLLTERWAARPDAAERIKPVIGDLAKPRLGVSDEHGRRAARARSTTSSTSPRSTT